MKVLHILNELKHSGAEVMLQLAFETFRSNGIEPHILSTGNYLGEYAASLRGSGYRIHHIPFRKNAMFFAEIWTLLKKQQFGAVHIHTERGFFWYVLICRLSNVPVIVRTFHNVFLFSSYLRWKRRIQRRLSKQVLGAIHVAVGESVLAVEEQRFQNKCILVRNWTDVNKFRPPSRNERAEARSLYNIKPDDFVIVTIGNCSPVKNHIAVLTAIQKTKDLGDGTNIVLLHIGTGLMVGQEKLYAKQHRLEEHCRFIGVLDDVRPCLYAADAYVMTSYWEGLGMAAVEAMSTGLPVILYKSYGLRDLLRDGRGGLLIEPDENSLSEALLQMMRRPDLRGVHAQEAHEKITRTYSLDESVNTLIGIYKAQTRKWD